jgi:mono/diheme cytochrome c family protein
VSALHRARARRLGPLLLCAAALVACGSPRRSEAVDGPLMLGSADLERGRVVFYQKCHKCHPGGEGGLGPELNDKPLPLFLMRLQVRQGLGTMPSFSEERISDDDLDRLLAYMKERRAKR